MAIQTHNAQMQPQVKALTLFGCPPVGHRHFTFSRGFNFLVGGSGSGKTSIAYALRTGSWRYGGGVRLYDPSISEFLGDHWSLSYIDGLHGYFPDECPKDHWKRIFVGVPRLQKKLGALLSVMISGKLGAEVTKFHSIPYVGEETFEIEINSKCGVEVRAGKALRDVEHSSPYGSIDQLFLASGEKQIINLAGILIAREEKKLDGPLVLDNTFRSEDEFAKSIIEQLRKLTCQIVILENQRQFEDLKQLELISPDDNIQAI